MTDERLRSWLDANQLSRERLCAGVLGVDGRFQRVEGRQPGGGADGGWDIECIDTLQRVWRVGVGFRNSASDSPADRRWAFQKMISDAEKAAVNRPENSCFGFMTNVKFSVQKRDATIKEVKKLGFDACELFDRERIRLLLDGADGLAIRFQFLGIPLSDAEQATFFNRWGVKIQAVIESTISRVEDRLARIEFLLEQDRPLRSLLFNLRLNAPIEENAHFRALMCILLPGLPIAHQVLTLATCNETKIRAATFSGGAHNTILEAFWSEEANKSENDEARPICTAARRMMSTGARTKPKRIESIGASGGFSEFINDPDQLALKDLDEAWIAVFVNATIASRIASVRVFANGYLILNLERSSLDFSEPGDAVSTPWTFEPSELSDPWVRVMPHGHPVLRFDEVTPTRMYRATPISVI
jgi:hypothetical protein